MATTATTARQAAEAIWATVKEQGQPAPRAVYELFGAFNAAHFGGRLGAPVIMIAATSGPRALGDYCGRDPHGLESHIRIRPSTLKRGMRYVADVLRHEMVHAWCQEVEGKPEDAYRGHGPAFAAKCNEIGKALGLPEVYAKPRGPNAGKPDCARWPLNVRAADYYGEENDQVEKEKAERAEKRKAKSRADREDGAAGDDGEVRQSRKRTTIALAHAADAADRGEVWTCVCNACLAGRDEGQRTDLDQVIDG